MTLILIVDEVLRHAIYSRAYVHSSQVYVRWNNEKADFYHRFNPLYLESDQHPISLYSNTAESFIEVTRKKEMVTNLRSFD